MREMKEMEGIEGAEKEVMGLRHRKYPMEGIQFHPESFATEGGKQMIANFIHRAFSIKDFAIKKV